MRIMRKMQVIVMRDGHRDQSMVLMVLRIVHTVVALRRIQTVGPRGIHFSLMEGRLVILMLPSQSLVEVRRLVHEMDCSERLFVMYRLMDDLYWMLIMVVRFRFEMMGNNRCLFMDDVKWLVVLHRWVNMGNLVMVRVTRGRRMIAITAT